MTVLHPVRQPASSDAGLPRHTDDAVRVGSLTKRFGEGASSVLALEQVSLHVRRGEFVCVVGASGCGKSTLLSLIAGLDKPTTGALEVAGRTALMFQDSALLPWRTAAANVELPMKLAGVGKAERTARPLQLLDLVRLREFAGKRPHELSGGMRQ